MANKITTYQDLISARRELKEEIIYIEEEIKYSKIVQISNFFISKGKYLRNVDLTSIRIPQVKDIINSPIGKVAGTYLLSNKKIRKYFIAFVVARKTIPYALTEIKKVVSKYRKNS